PPSRRDRDAEASDPARAGRAPDRGGLDPDWPPGPLARALPVRGPPKRRLRSHRRGRVPRPRLEPGDDPRSLLRGGTRDQGDLGRLRRAALLPGLLASRHRHGTPRPPPPVARPDV